MWTRIFSYTDKKDAFSKISGYVWTRPKVWISIRIVSSAQGFMRLFLGSGDSPTASLQFRPKPTSSGLDVEAKFYLQD